MKKTWLEVALNGSWTRTHQPRIPVGVAEIVADGIASVKAGAAIVHLHAYDEATGRQSDDADLYTRIGHRSSPSGRHFDTVEAIATGELAANEAMRPARAALARATGAL